MARMIPPQPPVGSGNEAVVYDILKACPGTEDWTILHQLDFSKHVSQAMGEADLIVCIPGHPLVFLEVKGYVRFINGQWFYGTDPEPKHSPFRQARGAMFSIKDWIEEEAPELPTFPWAFGAILVQTNWNVEIPDALPHQLIDSKSIDVGKPEQLRDAILNLGVSEMERLAKLSPPIRFATGEPPAERIERFIEILRPSVHPPHALVSSVWTRVLRFTQEQFAALDDCDVHHQMVFRGLAGTGKTVLALQLATMETGKGRSVLFVCFTQLAREKVQVAAEKLKGFSSRGVFELAIEMIRLSRGDQIAAQRSSELGKDSTAYERIL